LQLTAGPNSGHSPNDQFFSFRSRYQNPTVDIDIEIEEWGRPSEVLDRLSGLGVRHQSAEP
jgi:hypothetical protein